MPILSCHSALVGIGGWELAQGVRSLRRPGACPLIMAQPHPTVVLLRSDDLGVGVDQGLPPVGTVTDDPREGVMVYCFQKLLWSCQGPTYHLWDEEPR